MKFVEASTREKTGTPQLIFLDHTVVRRLFYSTKHKYLAYNFE
jgi:hypothetical protein